MLKNNAYHILGLDSTASQKDILHRDKELLAHIKMGDIPSYPLDVDIVEIPRTESTVKRALQDLQSPKNGMKDFFFWFHLADEIDEKAFAALKDKKYEEAFAAWKGASKTNSAKSFFYKKNLVILETLLLTVKDDTTSLKHTLDLWKSIIDSEKFWKFFEKAYEAQEHNSVTHEVFIAFRKRLPEYLSDIYADLYLTHKKTEYISEFKAKFNAEGEKFRRGILNPLYASINENVEILEGMKVSEDGVADAEERTAVRKANADIQNGMTVLQAFGFYDDSQTKILRDRAATALRSIAIDVNNVLDEHELAEEVAGMAGTLSGTEGLKKQIQDDLETIHGNVRGAKHTKVMEGIVALIKAGKFKEAIYKIDYHLAATDSDAELKELLNTYKSELQKKIALHGEPISSAPMLGTFNGIGLKIYGDTLYFVCLFVPLFPIARYSLQETGNSYSFFGKLKLHDWQRAWAGIAAIAGLFIAGSMASDSFNSSPSPSRSAYASTTAASTSRPSSSASTQNSDMVTTGQYTCTRYHHNQATALNPTDSEAAIDSLQRSLISRSESLDSLSTRIKTASVNEYSTQYEIDEHNRMIDEYNEKLVSFKSDAASAKERIRKYNAEADAHNKYLIANCTPTRRP